jgi:hypothetical protein
MGFCYPHGESVDATKKFPKVMIIPILVGLATALRFEIHATQGQGTVRCFEQYVLADNTITGFVDIPNRAFQTVDFLVFGFD